MYGPTLTAREYPTIGSQGAPLEMFFRGMYLLPSPRVPAIVCVHVQRCGRRSCGVQMFAFSSDARRLPTAARMKPYTRSHLLST